MPPVRKIHVSESVSKLEELLKVNSDPLMSLRLKMLLLIKQREPVGVSVLKLVDLLKVSNLAIQKWRRLYTNGGISLLLYDGRRKNTTPPPQEHGISTHVKEESPGQQYSSKFKLKVALKALQRKVDIQALCKKYDVPQNQIEQWTKILKTYGYQLFE